MSTDTPFGMLEAGRGTLERERRELVAERRAFEAFADRVADLEASERAARATPPTPERGSRPSQLRAPTGFSRATAPAGLSRVRRAYEETVMAVPHYEETYDDTALESMAGELSEEVASAVARESNFHPHLKRSLIETTERAIAGRDRLVRAIDRELEAIDAAEDELGTLLGELDSLLRQPLARMERNGLRLTGERLRTLRERCDDLAAERQRSIRRLRERTLVGIGRLEEYFYGDCELAYPVLAAIGRFGALLDAAVQYVDRRLAEIA